MCMCWCSSQIQWTSSSLCLDFGLLGYVTKASILLDLHAVDAEYHMSVLLSRPLLYFLFQKHSAAADITSSLSEDQVPEAFLVMVLIQFGTMVVDRALYLKKTVMGKVIFQVILVFGIHFWMFFILPGVTERYNPYNQTIQIEYWYSAKLFVFKSGMVIAKLWNHKQNSSWSHS